MNIHILASLIGQDSNDYLDQIMKGNKSSVFKALLLSFRVSDSDLKEYFPVVSFSTDGHEKYEELGYVMIWNVRAGELVFGQRANNN